MIRHGEPPYLECSGRGDKRFSAFWAKIAHRGYRTIEQLYQEHKEFPEGKLPFWKAKGKKALNQEECARLYSQLWDEYIKENPNLLTVLRSATGLSDVFGQEGHCCQATELWRIRNDPILPLDIPSEPII